MSEEEKIGVEEKEKIEFNKYMSKVTDNIKDMSVRYAETYTGLIEGMTRIAYNSLEEITKALVEDRVNERYSKIAEEMNRYLTEMKEYADKIGEVANKLAENLGRLITSDKPPEVKKEE